MILLNEIMCEAAYVTITFRKHRKDTMKGWKSIIQPQPNSDGETNSNIKGFVLEGQRILGSLEAVDLVG